MAEMGAKSKVRFWAPRRLLLMKDRVVVELAAFTAEQPKHVHGSALSAAAMHVRKVLRTAQSLRDEAGGSTGERTHHRPFPVSPRRRAIDKAYCRSIAWYLPAASSCVPQTVCEA